VSAASGRGVFDGSVKVNRLAQKTDAQQLSRNLLLVPRATVNVKPNLQVRCGAVGVGRVGWGGVGHI
jgi:Fe-S cluster assembly protein SufD